MLTPQQIRERVLNAIKNNPKGVVNALGNLSPQTQRNMQMRNILDSAALGKGLDPKPVPHDGLAAARHFKDQEKIFPK